MSTLLLVLATCSFGCGGKDKSSGPAIRHPQDFLPPGTEGMPKDGSPRVATDIAGLQSIVDGGYEVFANNGFREMVEQMYAGTVAGSAATVRVWIFDVGSAAHAEALHDELLQVGNWEEADQVGDDDRRRTELFTFTVLFRRNQYSAKLEIANTSQDAKDLLVLFATHIDQEITG